MLGQAFTFGGARFGAVPFGFVIGAPLVREPTAVIDLIAPATGSVLLRAPATRPVELRAPRVSVVDLAAPSSNKA